ncbi:MAG TPA: enoyl-CoA hydratase [Thiobacillus sp.]|uniref:enoyl-CoA hydratase n=2 Tax=unclassified Acidovorax TaxID=2684926 RepID=UPI0026089370|nr:enoyl-CoA hydratase [Acidovorax sp.]HQT19185.1 enoyl-CoA hydratase [Acidovorax defluvii]HQT71525.1 enoyl-CoA hydratase [Thiobacillus sp.]
MSIVTKLHNGVLGIEIARSEKKNAMTAPMYSAIATALRTANADPSVRSVLISGQPGIFCSGNDVEDFLTNPPNVPSAPLFEFMQALSGCEKPVVAAVTGSAIGIGVTMLLHCDLVYVAEGSRFAMPFVALAIVPEFASSLLFPRLVGHVKAAEKLLLGDAFTAREAVELNLANAVLAEDKVLDHARQVAERFNSLPPDAVRETKKLMRGYDSVEVSNAIALEGRVLSERLDSQDAKEAFSAFLQTRKATRTV